MKIAMICLCLFLATVSAARADTLVWKTEPELQSMIEEPGCDPDKDDDCHDSVAYIGHSKFGVNVYLTYFEAVRAQIGFGTTPNNVSLFLSDQLHEGAYDWGGFDVAGVFKPVFVIKRFYDIQTEKFEADKGRTQLLIFRLKKDGTSCAVPTDDTVTDNAKARKLAESALAGPECIN